MAKAKVSVDHSAISTGTATETNAPTFIDHLKNAVEPTREPTGQTVAPTETPNVDSRLARIVRGKSFAPPRALLYGTEGVGKSTLCSKTPKPIFISTEDGLGEIDCERFPQAQSYEDVIDALDTVVRGSHSYQTLVIDSVDWLESLVWAHVCRRNNATNIEKVGGGYAKGYGFALEEWREILGYLNRCRDRGMAIFLIAHAKIERFEDPENPAYDRYSPRLHKHATALLTEWVDMVLFATVKLSIQKEGDGFEKRAIAAPVGPSGGERVMRCIGSPACVAKNRYDLPAELPLSWNDLLAHMMKGRQHGIA